MQHGAHTLKMAFTFGASTPAAGGAGAGGFGGFGAAPTATPGFGAASTFGTPTATSTPAGFGAPASTGFGAPASTGFGAPTASSTGFGAPTASSTGFGAPASTGFGAPTASSTGFGAPAATSSTGFGTPAGFGAPASSSTGFGTPAGFGAPASSSTGFGAPASTVSLGFGTPAATSTAPVAQTGPTMTPARSEALSKIQLTADIDSLPQDVISYFVEIHKMLQTTSGAAEKVRKQTQDLNQSVQTSTQSALQNLAIVRDLLNRDRVMVEDLKNQLATTFHHADYASRTVDRLKTVQGPVPGGSSVMFFHRVVEDLQARMQSYKRQISELEEYLKTLQTGHHVTAQELLEAMRSQHETMVALAGRVANLHNDVEAQKEAFRRVRGNDINDPFDRSKKASASAASSAPLTKTSLLQQAQYSISISTPQQQQQQQQQPSLGGTSLSFGAAPGVGSLTSGFGGGGFGYATAAPSTTLGFGSPFGQAPAGGSSFSVQPTPIKGVGAPSTLGFNTFTPGPQTTTASAGLLFSATGSAGGFGTASGTGFGPLGSASSLPSPSTPVGVGLLNPAPTKKKR